MSASLIRITLKFQLAREMQMIQQQNFSKLEQRLQLHSHCQEKSQTSCTKTTNDHQCFNLEYTRTPKKREKKSLNYHEAARPPFEFCDWVMDLNFS